MTATQPPIMALVYSRPEAGELPARVRELRRRRDQAAGTPMPPDAAADLSDTVREMIARLGLPNEPGTRAALYMLGRRYYTAGRVDQDADDHLVLEQADRLARGVLDQTDRLMQRGEAS